MDGQRRVKHQHQGAVEERGEVDLAGIGGRMRYRRRGEAVLIGGHQPETGIEADLHDIARLPETFDRYVALRRCDGVRFTIEGHLEGARPAGNSYAQAE